MSRAMITLFIDRSEYEVMLAHLLALYPEEGCGLLGGRAGYVRGVYPVENRLHSSVAFEMDPQQQLEAMQEIEDKGDTMLAIYHSHPHGPLWPSEDDVARAYYPDAIYVIISLARAAPTVRAFTIRERIVHEIVLTIS